MHKRFFITIAIVLLGITAYQIFGHKELNVIEVDAPPLFVVGKSYKGFAGDKPVERALKETEKLLDKGLLSGALSVWYYGNPDQNQDSLNIIIGAVRADSTQDMPIEYELFRIQEGKVLRAILDPTEIFAPTPNEVNETLLDSAKIKNLGERAYLYSERYVITNDKRLIWNDIYVK
ncbi:MAG: hypothetical protein ACPGJS_07435 [Flammeovirgaceae bacterium]